MAHNNTLVSQILKLARLRLRPTGHESELDPIFRTGV